MIQDSFIESPESVSMNMNCHDTNDPAIHKVKAWIEYFKSSSADRENIEAFILCIGTCIQFLKIFYAKYR